MTATAQFSSAPLGHQVLGSSSAALIADMKVQIFSQGPKGGQAISGGVTGARTEGTFRRRGEWGCVSYEREVWAYRGVEGGSCRGEAAKVRSQVMEALNAS